MTAEWFAVDRDGLARLMARNGGAPRAVLELIANAWDAPDATRVDVTLTPTGRGLATITVTDDAPDGFTDLAHAFTLFAQSEKVTDPEKRGRFNLGEKMVLAACVNATITSTRGSVTFDRDGRRTSRTRLAAGSEFTATIRLTRTECADVTRRFRTLISPPTMTTTLNGDPLPDRTPVTVFTVPLRTEVADSDGTLRPTTRTTTVRLYEPDPDETSRISEMGIPVVEWDTPWHADIGQKVPLNFERDNVTPAYLRALRVAVLNATHDRLPADEAASEWVKAAAADPTVDPAAVTAVVTARWGDKAVAYDPHDQQANAEAVLRGYTVVHGGSMSSAEWANTRRAGVLRPAGQVTPSNSTVHTHPDGTPPIPTGEWTPGQRAVAAYAAALGAHLLGYTPTVEITRSTQNYAAAFGGRTLTLNLRRLGHRWFDTPDQAKVDELLIHEFAHDAVADHLSEAYHRELCRLGAAMRHARPVIVAPAPAEVRQANEEVSA